MSPRQRLFRVAALVVLGALAGVVWGNQFGASARLLAPWVALVPAILLLEVRRPFWMGWWIGIATWFTALPWIASTLETFGQLHPFVAFLGLLFLALFQGSYFAVFAGLGAGHWRRGGWLAWIGLPALWVAVEVIRGHILSGFPWNLAGYAWVEMPGALGLTAWVGTHGLSFLLLTVNVAIAMSVRARRIRPAFVAVFVALIVLALGARWGAGSEPSSAEAKEARALPASEVRLLQPNIPNLVVWDSQVAERNYRKVLDQSRQACDQDGALLIWPESAAWPYSWASSPALRYDLRGLVQQGCSILVNTPMEMEEDVWFNSAVLADQELLLDDQLSPSKRYDKGHLVPFGEYVPFAGLIPFYDSLTRNVGDFSAAENLQLLAWGDEQLGVSICYEVIFPEEVAQRVRRGATLLVTMTNDAWYGDTSAPWQHFRAARFRAAENRRPLLRAAITGISGVVAADGSIVSRLGVGEEGVLAARIAGRRDLSPYTRAPWLIPILCFALAGFAIFWRRLEERKPQS